MLPFCFDIVEYRFVWMLDEPLAGKQSHILLPLSKTSAYI